MNNLSRRSLLGFGSAGLGVAGLAALGACASQKNPSDSATGGSDSSGADSGDWPRTVTDEQGEVTIDKQAHPRSSPPRRVSPARSWPSTPPWWPPRRPRPLR